MDPKARIQTEQISPGFRHSDGGERKLFWFVCLFAFLKLQTCLLIKTVGCLVHWCTCGAGWCALVCSPVVPDLWFWK